jgi:membrane peptidoglycan carboxypeptidase
MFQYNKGIDMKYLKKMLKIGIILTIILFIIIFIIYVIAYFMPTISLNTANSYYLYDNKDNLVYQGSNTTEWVSLNNIDDDYLTYIINVEDKYFYYHAGFDILRIGKSLINNIIAGKIVAGASSISQQYVKNLFLSFDQTWERKFNEAILTIRLETHYSKDEILEGYLNTIYFGNGIYGIKDASEYYFNKDISDITTEEAIILAGIPKSPNNYNPISNIESCKKRFNIVAKYLYDENILSEEEYKKLDFDSVNLYGKHQNNNLSTLMYYQSAVLDELQNLDVVNTSLIKNGSLRIFTNLDLDTQSKMEESIIENINSDDDVQVASIVINPNNGAVLALAGGTDYSKSQYNRVTSAKRQVGSTIKPFLYYAALNNGMTVSSTFKSASTTFVFSNNKTYSPTNYNNHYANKEISMGAALAYSDNIYAVKTHLFLGESTLVNTLKTCGLKTSLPSNPSLALGAYEINMLDYAGAYSTLASGGIKNDTYFINRIEDKDGNILYQHVDNSKQVLDERITYILNETLTNTYNYDLIDELSPTVIYLNGKLSRKYAIKSGTTDNDYWLVGYNKDVLMMVWSGNDLNESVSKEYSKKIKNIWLDTVEYYERDKLDTWYNMPDGVSAMPVDPVTGKYDISSKTLYYYLDGTELAYIQ